MKTDKIEVELAEEGTLMAEFQKERTDAITEMFDNQLENGIYPTSDFFARLDKKVQELFTTRENEVIEIAKDYMNLNDWYNFNEEITSKKDIKSKILDK